MMWAIVCETPCPIEGTGVFRYDCFGETLSFAESLGWANWLDDVDDDTDPQTIDEAEVDALNFIREKGFTIEME